MDSMHFYSFDEFMLFYISPYYDMPLAFLNNVRDRVGFPIYVILYIMGVCFGVVIMCMFVKMMRKFINKNVKVS